MSTLRHIDKARVLAAQAAGRTQSIGRTVATLSALLAELDLAVFCAQADAIDLAELQAYRVGNQSPPPSVGSDVARKTASNTERAAVAASAMVPARSLHSEEADHG